MNRNLVNYLVGTAPVKVEYLISLEPQTTLGDDDAAERTSGVRGYAENADGDRPGVPGASKKTKDQKKAQRGSNKGRKFGKIRDEVELCWKVATGTICEYGAECRFTHDVATYLLTKAPDVRIPGSSEFRDSSPYLQIPIPDNIVLHEKYPSINLNVSCPIFEEVGECKYGLKCRYLGGHVGQGTDGSIMTLKDEDRLARGALSSREVNFMSADVLKAVRSKKYPLPITERYLRELKDLDEKERNPKPPPIEESMQVTDIVHSTDGGESPPQNSQVIIASRIGGERLGTGMDSPDVAVRYAEKKRLHWAGKTYLAPLTTVGNLPFRRLCVDYGADITCGEMGLASSFLAGAAQEWSLVRRHPVEKIFGVQLAGNKPMTLVPTAEIIAKELCGNVDFVDVNCGCPIDLVFRTGSGSALLDAAGRLGKILIGMNRSLGDIPVTVKLRSGVRDGKNNAHKLMPRLATEWGASCITLHGRSRQQRYSRLADWDYIKRCVHAVRAQEADEDLPPVPIFGGGDCYSSVGYWNHVENTGVDGIMVGRGALIKPWIFTEIKERREWDITARERLDHIRKYAEYGLNHFGSDTTGVNATRRYLCEALSFQYRYIPIGLLEHLPGRINDRAPAFRGRSDLETLLSSPNSQDWVKISEMFLGPAPESWTFTPKHKSNAYGTEESQG